MATITLLQLRSAIQDQGNFKTTDTRLTSTALTSIVNRALRQVALDHDWFWLRVNETLNTVAGTSTITLGGTTPFLRLMSLTHQDVGTPLMLREVGELDRITTAGRPILYSIENSTLIVKPTPDRVYAMTHRFIRPEIVLVADGDTPLCPLEFAEGVILYGLKLAHQFIQQTDKATAAKADYASWLNRATDNNARSREPWRVRVRPGSMF